MKKIMILLALVAGTQFANAQKTADACQKTVAAAQAATQDPKKAAKPATWLNLAKAAMEAYNAPRLNGWIGGSRPELQMVMSGSKVLSSSEEQINGANYIVDHYASCDYYYSENTALAAIYVTKPYVEDALGLALNAYAEAGKVDNGSKTKDICEGIKKIVDNYQNDAMTYYTLGNLAKASESFEKAAEASATAPYSQYDTSALYNSGLTAYMAGLYESAATKMEKCASYGYYEKGEVFAKLADCKKQLKDTVACKNYLEEGFKLCPDNQSILVGLINLYLETNDDPEKLFALLDIAKKNEPSNASLYYVEGNIRKQLGQLEKAVEAYNQCAAVNPNYEFGYIGIGLAYFEEALKIQEAAQTEFNDAKYNALVKKMDEALKNAIAPFEKGFELTKSNDTKVGVAEYLKNICFRYRDQAEYQAKYDSYNNFIQSNK